MTSKDEIHIVNQCNQDCPFFELGVLGLASCIHPLADDKVSEEIIINSIKPDGWIPNQCPLRKEEIIIKKTVRLRIRN